MIILGLDPGIARTGFGLIDTSRSAQFVQCGCLTTPAHQPVAERLLTLGNDLASLIETHHPQQAVIEDIFFGANRTTAVGTAQVRGVLLYILGQHHIPVHSFTPLQIKSRLVGYGRATKHQVQQLVTKRLSLNTPPQPDDAADALAAALCLSDAIAVVG